MDRRYIPTVILLLAALVIIAMIAGCASTSRTEFVAPPVKQYTAKFQNETADELQTCANCKNMKVMLGDYARLIQAINEIEQAGPQ